MTRPQHLMVFLSNLCNLSCDYCFVAVNAGAPVRLEFAQFQKAFERFLDASDAGGRRITFLGGEPFLQFPILIKMIEHARRTPVSGPISINVFTNGTLLSADALHMFEDLDVWTILSLDGKKETNDARRVYADSTRSVYDAVMGRVDRLPKSRMGVNMVFNASNVGSLIENIDLFYRNGFRSINFYPELYEIWPPERLDVLRTVLLEFEEYYASKFEPSEQPFSVPALPQVLSKQADGAAGVGWWRECGNLVLGGDGQFHICDKAMSFPLESISDRESVVGNPMSGLDWRARSSRYQAAAKAVDDVAGLGADFAFCPMGTYFFSRWSGEPMAPRLRNLQEVGRIYAGTFAAISRRLGGVPAFQEFYHLPA